MKKTEGADKASRYFSSIQDKSSAKYRNNIHVKHLIQITFVIFKKIVFKFNLFVLIVNTRKSYIEYKYITKSNSNSSILLKFNFLNESYDNSQIVFLSLVKCK